MDELMFRGICIGLFVGAVVCLFVVEYMYKLIKELDSAWYEDCLDLIEEWSERYEELNSSRQKLVYELAGIKETQSESGENQTQEVGFAKFDFSVSDHPIVSNHSIGNDNSGGSGDLYSGDRGTNRVSSKLQSRAG